MDPTLPVRALATNSADDGLIEMAAGSTHPPLRARLVDANDRPVKLGDVARVTLHLYDGDGSAAIERSATIADASSGIVEYEWRDGDTEPAGIYHATFDLHNADGSTLTAPSRRPITVRFS